MLRRRSSELRSILLVADAASTLGVLLELSSLRFHGDALAAIRPVLPEHAGVATLAYVAGWLALLAAFHQYPPRTQWSLRNDAIGTLRATLAFAGLVFALLVVLEAPYPSRLLLFALFPLQAAIAIAIRVLTRLVFGAIRARGRDGRNVVVLGTGQWAQGFAVKLEDHPGLGLHVVGFLGDGGPALDERWRYLGGLDELERALREYVVDEVAICLPVSQWSLVEPIVQLCEDQGKVVRLPLSVAHRSVTRGRLEELDGIPVFSLANGPERGLALAGKRTVDILGATAGLIVLSPVLLVTALLIRWLDGPPIFFRQERVGLHGRKFRILKFRTMVVDAESLLPDVLALNRIEGPGFQLDDDPRVTKLGRFLRRASIDEFPQLWDVLMGRMSLVGPRPAPMHEVAGYDIWHRRRLSLKPGITGLAQVEARRYKEFDQKANLDLRYIDRWSLGLDLRILLRTVPMLLRFTGR